MRLIPLDALWQIGHDADPVVLEANGAGVLAGFTTQRLGAVREAQCNGAIEPFPDGLGGLQRRAGLQLQQSQMLGR